MSLEQIVRTKFEEHFHYQASDVTSAPGRVNLIGDHTDYNDGFVLPAAINLGTTIAAAPRDDNLVHVVASDFEDDYALIHLNDIRHSNEKVWLNYISGTLKVIQQQFGPVTGMDLVIAGNLPIGAGLSSSASLEIAVLNAARRLNNLNLGGIDAAKLGQHAENDFVGCNCGIMDQLISAMGKERHAMLLDCRSLTFKDARIPPNLEIMIINSNVKRGLVDSAYNDRRKQCEDAASLLGKKALRDISVKELFDNRSHLTDVQYKRARHVVTENQRTVAAYDALNSGDVKTLSRLMRESHISIRDDFQVSTKEMDWLVEMVSGVIGNRGGVRMTGGGFGGCVVALTPSELVNEIRLIVGEDYPVSYGRHADIYTCTASRGPFRD